MCGINGILSFNSPINDRDVHSIKKMNTSIEHRGPDAEGIYDNDNIILGHRRLSIVDIGEQSNQPMKSEDARYTIVFNGEIYNFKELKKTIDYPYKTNSDTELIIAAYSKYGKDCVYYFNGMFAFAIWDELKKELFIARDRLGIKPLYYIVSDDRFIFSSSVTSILESGQYNFKLNKEKISQYLKFQTTYEPNTLDINLKSLEAGSTIIINKGSKRHYKYWDIKDKISTNNSLNYDSIKRKTSQLLYESVELRMNSDVEFGAFLSGGIDSTLLVGLMAEIKSNQKINTFNIAFKESKFSEATIARETAKIYNTEHHEIILTADQLLTDTKEALHFLDYPSADGINTYIVSKHTKNKGIKMALSGLGGDELLGGYPQFKQAKLLDKLSFLDKIPYSLRNNISKHFFKVNDPMFTKIGNWLKLEKFSFEEYYPLFRSQANDSELVLWTDTIDPKINYFHDSDLMNNMSINEINTYMRNILLRDSDQMSMANSIELRLPFLDHNFVEHIIGINPKYKNPFHPKKLLIDSFPEILTPRITNRKKMGFLLPWNIWLKNELKEYTELQLMALKDRKIINNQEIDKIWSRFLSGDKNIYWTRIWGLVAFSKWLSKLDR